MPFQDISEVQNLKKYSAIKNRCFVESIINGLINEKLFAWDSFGAHLVQSVKDLLNRGKIDLVIIPGGGTGHIQVADVSWNEPTKDQLRKMYSQWMDEEPHTHTRDCNMSGLPLKQVVQWILIAWLDLDKKIFVKSFCCFDLSIQDDGSEDNKIGCFKPGKPLSSGLERLKAAMTETAKELVDAFTESDIENDPDLVIDLDREVDEDIDIE